MASQGDIRVLLIMNAVLSFVFSTIVVTGLAFIDVVAFTWRTVGVATIGLMVLTYFVTIR